MRLPLPIIWPPSVADSLNSEVIKVDLVTIAADENTHTAGGERGIVRVGDLDAIDDERQSIPDGCDRHIVDQCARLDSRRTRPGDKINPEIAVASPDAHIAAIANLEHVSAEDLVYTVEYIAR